MKYPVSPFSDDEKEVKKAKGIKELKHLKGSPHKKGSKAYKKHMAAKHAAMEDLKESNNLQVLNLMKTKVQ